MFQLLAFLEFDLILEQGDFPQQIGYIDIGIKLYFILVGMKSMESLTRSKVASILVGIVSLFLDILDDCFVHAE